MVVKFCSDCGEPHCTGSQIYVKCPVNGNYRSLADTCNVNGKEVKK